MVSAGHKFRASDIPGDPIEFEPAWTATTTDPTNYSSVGYYFMSGSLIHAHARFTPDVGFTAGSGYYLFELPDAMNAALGVEHDIGTGLLRDSGTSRRNLGAMPQNAGASTIYLMYDDGSGLATPVSHNTPITMVSGDAISYHVWFWV
jgi:hypothetical protein